MPDPMFAPADWQAAYDRARQAASWLSGLLSPRSAEAKVRPLDERSAAVLQEALAGSAGGISPNVSSLAYQRMPRLDPFKQELYQTIASQAERLPEDVTVQYGMRGNPLDMANYDPRERSIVLSSGEMGALPPADPRVQGAFGHELLHFLLGSQGYQGEQHPLIKAFLGTDIGDATSPRHELAAQPFSGEMTPEMVEALRRLLEGTALQQRVGQPGGAQ